MTATDPVRTLVAQTDPVLGDVAANEATAEEILSEARAIGCDLVVFPELFLTGYHIGDDAAALTAHAEAALDRLRAATTDLVVVIGTPVASEPGIRNAAVIIDDETLVGRYDKTHLWGDEPSIFEPGDEFPTFETHAGTIGVQICYDVEFPEVSRSLAMNGADTLVTISANMRPHTRDQELYHGVRALENGCPHVLCNRVGEERGVDFFGESGIVTHRGRRILALGSDVVQASAGRIPADPDRSNTHEYLNDRQPDLYDLS